MRDITSAFQFPSEASSAPSLMQVSVFPDFTSPTMTGAVPAGLLAAALLANWDEEERDEAGAYEKADAWLDRALEDSFPASDPIAGNCCK